MDANGKKLRRLNPGEAVIIVYRLLREHGLDVGHHRFQKLMEAEGFEPVGTSTYYRVRRLVEKLPPDPLRDAPDVVPGYEEQSPAERVGTLQEFVRFSSTVEAVGGVKVARQYLALLERMFARQP